MTKNYLPGAEPLFLEGKSKGLLLLHGAGGGCTWDLKEFAKKAQEREFTVWLPALPGFGTKSSDLLGIKFDDWLNTASEGVERLRDICSSVSIVGHSMGGLISLVLAARDKQITSVVCWAAPWKVKSLLLPVLPLISSIPFVRRIIPEFYPTPAPARLKDMGWVGYDRIPTALGFVMLNAFKQLQSSISNASCPVFVVQGSKDESVKSQSAQEIFRRLSNLQKKIWIIEGATHPLMQDFCKEELFQRSLDFIERNLNI
ncbi:MAG: alpha/beta hydrolase [Candidatus Hodarchaeota archaeon]